MNSRRILVIITLVLAGAFLFPTMAAPLTGNGDQIAETAIVLEPYGGPNGAYAVMKDQNGDGDLELGLDFSDSNEAVPGDGVDANSLTPIHRVFTITNTGDEVARVYLTDSNDDITFYRGTDPGDSLESESNARVVGPEQSLVVGVLIDTRDGNRVENADEFTVHADPVDTSTPAETETETTTTEENGGGGGGGGGGDEITIQSRPTPEPTTADANDGGNTETSRTTTDADSQRTGGNTTTDPGTSGTTTTVTVRQAGTTLSPPGSAADPGADPGQRGNSGLTLGGLPWWLVLLALLVAAVIAGYGYRRLGT